MVEYRLRPEWQGWPGRSFVDKIGGTFQYSSMRKNSGLAILTIAFASSCAISSIGTRPRSRSFRGGSRPGGRIPTHPAQGQRDTRGLETQDSDLAVTAASLAAMYAAGFVSADAAGIPTEEIDARLEANLRAKRLFMRAFRRMSDALDRRQKGLMAALSAGEASGLKRLKVKDVPVLYWGSASALGAFSLDPSILPHPSTWPRR